MKIKEITDAIERFAPLALQEEYDNAGLVVGDPEREVGRALLAVDVTEEVLAEAEQEGCDLVVTHHPIVFHPLKRLNEADYVQRCVARAVRRDIALYACHTNLDSADGGMSFRLGQLLGLQNMRTLKPNPETVPESGFGIVGELPGRARPTLEFLRETKRLLNCDAIRYSALCRETVSRIALCTGAGASMIEDAVAAGADLYLSSDFKYNDFYTPDGRIVAADVGHFESEYCAIALLHDIITKKIATFAVRKSEHSINPVNYLV